MGISSSNFACPIQGIEELRINALVLLLIHQLCLKFEDPIVRSVKKDRKEKGRNIEVLKI